MRWAPHKAKGHARGRRTVSAMVSVASVASTLTAVSGGLESAAASAAVPWEGGGMSVAV